MPETTKANWFTVTVSRINESANKDPYMTMSAHSLTLSKDGYLTISSDDGQQGFMAGGFDGFEVKTLRMPPKKT